MRYVDCKFRPGDAKGYAYSYDGAIDLKPGDKVEVETARRPGTAIVEVIGFREKPDFECKPILRVLPRQDQGAA